MGTVLRAFIGQEIEVHENLNDPYSIQYFFPPPLLCQYQNTEPKKKKNPEQICKLGHPLWELWLRPWRSRGLFNHGFRIRSTRRLGRWSELSTGESWTSRGRGRRGRSGVARGRCWGPRPWRLCRRARPAMGIWSSPRSCCLRLVGICWAIWRCRGGYESTKAMAMALTTWWQIDVEKAMVLIFHWC